MIITAVGIVIFMLVLWVGISKKDLVKERDDKCMLGFAYTATRSRHDVT